MTTESKTYRELINLEYSRRKEKNKSYSMRAFARDLNLDPGQLSHVLNGKKNFSLSKASEVAPKLYKTPREIQIFYHSVELDLCEDKKMQKEIEKKIQVLNKKVQERESNISDDEFDTISNWYNIPLLELAGSKEISLTPEYGAKYLGIPLTEALLGLQAMARLGFLKKAGESFSKLKSVYTTTEVPSLAIKSFHLQMIKKAQDALFKQDTKKRYYSGATFMIPAHKLDELKKMISENEERILEFAKTHEADKDQVLYHLNSHLFSLKAEDNT